METAAVLVAASIFLWGTVSARLERADLTAPVVFMTIGAGMVAADIVEPRSGPEQVLPLVEIALVWVLFADAARVRIPDFRADIGRFARLLGLGLPLTVLFGWALAVWLLPDLDWWLALLVAAALAPTDAALGVPVVTNPLVPNGIRRLISVESGLNDGIITPVVMLALAGAAGDDSDGVGRAAVELGLGAAIGVTVGGGGGRLLQRARHRGWAAEDFSGIAVLALALVAYTLAVAAEGNGFVAAFCGGLAFGGAVGRRAPEELALLEQASGLVSLLVWLVFGAIAAPIVVDHLDPSTVLYAVLSLTVVRMVPVAIASVKAGFSTSTVLFVGWFGPRGLASLIFALLAAEQLGSHADEAVSVVTVTVTLSVLAHGLSAGPLAERYGGHTAHPAAHWEPTAEIPVRGLPRRGTKLWHIGHRSS